MGRNGDGGGDRDQQPDRDHLHELRAFERPVDHRRQGKDESDRGEHGDRDPAHVAADQIGGQRRRAGHPARPEIGEDGEQGEDQAPMAAEPGEAGQHRLAGRERVALDLHVDEELGGEADRGRPEKDEADLARDIGKENELARGEADTGRDHAGPDDPPGRGRRRRQFGRAEIGQMPAAPLRHQRALSLHC